jgi:hypothetical protein
MINPFAEINWNPEKKDILSFGKSMLIGFSAISSIFLVINLFRLPIEEAIQLPLYIFGVGGVLFIIANIGGVPAKVFYFIWFALAATIGVVISNLLLAMFYYLFFSVFAVIFRTLSGRDPLTVKKDPSKKSWWVKVSGEKSLKSYFKQY